MVVHLAEDEWWLASSLWDDGAATVSKVSPSLGRFLLRRRPTVALVCLASPGMLRPAEWAWMGGYGLPISIWVFVDRSSQRPKSLVFWLLLVFSYRRSSGPGLGGLGTVRIDPKATFTCLAMDRCV